MLPKVKSYQIQRKGDHLRDRPEFMSKCYYVSLVPTLSKKNLPRIASLHWYYGTFDTYIF